MKQVKIGKVGVLIPTYNRHSYLADALKSACAQTWNNVDIIVIDNGSTDGTAEFMKGISDPRVRYITNDRNLGLIGSINRGISLFPDEVEWCTILCDDDVLHIDFISQMSGFFENHPELLIAYSHILFVDNMLQEIRHAVESPMLEPPLSYFKARSYAKRESYLSSFLFHKKSLIEIGGYPKFASGFWTDDALLFHLSVKAGVLGYQKDACCSIRIHEAAESVSIPGGLRPQFDAALDFKRYCLRIAQEYKLHEAIIIRLVNHKIKGFLYVLCTTHFKSQLKFHDGKDDFFRTLKDVYPYLPLRVKLDYLAYSYFQIALERYRPYTMGWELIGNTYKLLRAALM